jgi:tRNA (adenine-N(1)-)-methyltransferase non-catalytic subunit
LVICIKNETDLIITVLQLMVYLKYSGTLIVFAKEIDILLELEKTLVENKIVLDVRINETISREYQVLPLRTHPMMNNRGFSGYVLTAIKIFKA